MANPKELGQGMSRRDAFKAIAAVGVVAYFGSGPETKAAQVETEKKMVTINVKFPGNPADAEKTGYKGPQIWANPSMLIKIKPEWSVQFKGGRWIQDKSNGGWYEDPTFKGFPVVEAGCGKVWSNMQKSLIVVNGKPTVVQDDHFNDVAKEVELSGPKEVGCDSEPVLVLFEHDINDVSDLEMADVNLGWAYVIKQDGTGVLFDHPDDSKTIAKYWLQVEGAEQIYLQHD